MNLGEIRKQYPQYADIPDRELALGLHGKFYADMPKAEFFQKIGFDSRAETAKRIESDHITRGAKQNAAPIPSLVPILEQVAKGGISPSPMGTMTNVAAQGVNDLMTRGADRAGGAVTDFASSRGASVPVAAGLGTAANVATQAIPMLVGGAGGSMAGQAAAPAARTGAQKLMRMALKPSPQDWVSGKGPRAINTMLDEGVNVSSGGVQKLLGGVKANSAAVDDILARSGATVNKGQAAQPIQDVVRGIERSNPTPNAAIADAERVYNEFLANHLIPQNMPVQQAQELKQGLYKILSQKYGPGVVTTDTQAAQKGLARGLRQGIESVEPSVAPINAANQELINALKVASRREATSGNKDFAGLAWLANDPMSGGAFMASRSELAKSLLARALNQSGKNAPAIGGVTGAAIGANAREGE